MRNHERAAAQAYVRLLEATRAALADPDEAPLYMPLLASPIEEADGALRRAGLSGNEAHFFALVSAVRSGVPDAER